MPTPTNAKIHRYAKVLCKQLEEYKRQGVTRVFIDRPGILMEAALTEIATHFKHRADHLPTIVMPCDDASLLDPQS